MIQHSKHIWTVNPGQSQTIMIAYPEAMLIRSFIFSSTIKFRFEITKNYQSIVVGFVDRFQTYELDSLSLMLDPNEEIRIVLENYDQHTADIYTTIVSQDTRTLYEAQFTRELEQELSS